MLEQDATKAWYSIDANITHHDEKKRVEMVVMPSMEYKVTTLIDFNSPVLGTQHAGLKTMRDFKTEISPCRTFCFLHELEMLLDHNLVKGGDINNAIVVVDKLMLPVPATAVAEPAPQPVKALSPFGVATTNPAGSVSVKPMPVCVVVESGLVTVKVRVVVPPTGIEDAPNTALIVVGATTVRFALAVLPVPPLVLDTAPVVSV